MTSQDAWTDLSIGDAVEDANGRRWWVLNRPDGSGACDGLFAAATSGYGQRYGEHMVRPLAVLDHRCSWAEPCSRPLEPHCPPISEPGAEPHRSLIHRLWDWFDGLWF